MRTALPSDVSHIYADIYAERQAQIDKWGPQHRNLGTGSKAWQTRADKARERCDAAEKDSNSPNPNDKATWLHVLEEEFCEAMAEADLTKLRTELIQSAAVIVAIIEDLEENHAPELSDKTTYL